MQLTKSEVCLEEIAPEILVTATDGVRVIIISTVICPRCDRTVKLLDQKGIASVKYVIEDRFHPVLVALRKHLGLEPEAPVDLPAVFVDGVFRWHHLNPAAVLDLSKEFENEAEAAA